MFRSQLLSRQPIRLVIFECDGVLFNSPVFGHSIEVVALKSLNVDIDSQEYQKQYAGVTIESAFNIIAQDYGIYIPAPFIRDVEEKIINAREQGIEVIHHVHDILQKINICKTVASNIPFSRLSTLLTLKTLIHFFDGHIFSADMVREPKPAPDLYLYVAKKLLVPVGECLVIEDSATGVKAAHQAGMNVLGFINAKYPSSKSKQELLEAGALQVFCTMKKLPEIINSLRRRSTFDV